MELMTRISGLVSEELLQFKTTIKNIWFTLYKRSNALSSSGVEHVQIGEIKGKSVSGFHNWVRFCVLEHSGHINYLGHTRIVDLGDVSAFVYKL